MSKEFSDSPIPSPRQAPSVAAIRGGATIPMPGPGVTFGGDDPAPEPSESVLAPPFEIPGLYSVESVLSKGGMGTTYLGHRLRDKGQEVVIKVPDTHSSSTLRRFEKECRTLEQLDHDNVVKCLGYGTFIHGGMSYPYLAMSYVKGQTLRQRLEGGRMSWEEVKALLENMLEALVYIASKGICHRDIKPENIIYDDDRKKWVLVDFGIAKSSIAQEVLKTLEENDGTWDYMSPEQKNGEQVDIRSDIYSLGKVAWEALLGVRPEVGTKLPYAAGVKGCTPDVDTLIEKMVEFSPKDRYPTPKVVLEALERGAIEVKIEVQPWRFLRRLCCCLGALALLWFTGDFVCTAKLRQIAAEAKSPTVQIREMEAAVGSYPLYWGRSYLQSEEVEAIRKKADREYEKMLSEFNRVKNIFEDNNVTIEVKRISFKNFLVKWKEDFSGTSEYQEVKGYSKTLPDGVDEWIKDLKHRLENASSYEACCRVIEAVKAPPNLPSEDAKDLIEAAEAKKTQFVQAECAEIKKLVENNTVQPEKVKERLEQGRHSNIPEVCVYVDELVEARWSGCIERVKGCYIDNFSWAFRELKKVEGMYPSPKNIKIDEWKEKCADAMIERAKREFSSCRSDDVNLPAVYELYCEYRSALSSWTEVFRRDAIGDRYCKRLRQFMCGVIHEQIDLAVQNEFGSPGERLKKIENVLQDILDNDDFLEYLYYLKELQTSAKGYIVANTNDIKEARYHYLYCWQKMPSEWHPLGEAIPHKVARIRIKNVRIDLSKANETYKKFAGWFSSDPYIGIMRFRAHKDEQSQAKSELLDSRYKARIEGKVFKVDINKVYYFDVSDKEKPEKLKVSLQEKGPDKDVSCYWFVILARDQVDNPEHEQTKSLKSKDGCEFTVTYQYE
ncbi:MAG: serine/threonine-protein kinase [Bacteroidales bacterium]|nr:serine/threonine-protein kinase [Bacteroidales bacterium]